MVGQEVHLLDLKIIRMFFNYIKAAICSDDAIMRSLFSSFMLIAQADNAMSTF